jgi:hypothetical protein
MKKAKTGLPNAQLMTESTKIMIFLAKMMLSFGGKTIYS